MWCQYEWRKYPCLKDVYQGNRTPEEYYQAFYLQSGRDPQPYSTYAQVKIFIDGLNDEIWKHMNHYRYVDVLDALDHANEIYYYMRHAELVKPKKGKDFTKSKKIDNSLKYKLKKFKKST